MRLFYALLFAFCLNPLSAAPYYSPNNVHQHPSQDQALARALRIGTDTDGKPLFLCIGRLLNSTQPGKTWAGYGRCNVPYGGKEYIVNDYQVPPANAFGHVFWQNAGGTPLAIGRDTNGNPLFLCQAYFKGSKQPGKTWPGYNHCNISYAGQEIITDNYRILSQEGGQANYHQHASQNPQQQCITDPFGHKACGYHCIKSMNNVACAASPDQQCVSDNFGRIVCGYGCVQSPLKVACARSRSKNCVMNSFNEIRCGTNCRMDNFNRIQCDD